MSYVLKSGFDMTGYGGNNTPQPNSTIADCELQDVDATGHLVWKWDASDHVDPVTENTFGGKTTVNGVAVYDAYHCNSIDQDPVTGDVLISARHNNALYDINRSTGKIVWKMGGVPSNKDG